MKTQNIKYLAIIIFLFASSIVYSQSAKEKIYYIKHCSIAYRNEIIENKDSVSSKTELSAYNTKLNEIYKVIFINDTLINVSSAVTSNTDINIRRINSVSFRSSSVNIGAWAGLLIGALVGGYYAGESVSPGVGRVFSIFGGALLGGFIGGSILGSITPPSDHYESYNIGKYNLDKKKELQKILMENSSR